MTETIKKLSAATDEHAAYVLQRIAIIEECEKDITTRHAQRDAAMRESGLRLIEVHAIRSRQASKSDTSVSDLLRGTWYAWLEDNGIPQKTADRHMKFAGYTEEERTEKKQKEAKRKRESRAKQFRIGWPSLLLARLNLPPMTFRGSQGMKVKAALNPPEFFTDEAAADAFVDAYVKHFGANLKTQRQPLPPRDEKKVAHVIQLETERLKKTYHEAVRQKAVEETAKLRDHFHAKTKEVERELLRSRALPKMITEEEYRLVLNCLHPDRAPEERRERFAKAFSIVQRLLGKMFD